MTVLQRLITAALFVSTSLAGCTESRTTAPLPSVATTEKPPVDTATTPSPVFPVPSRHALIYVEAQPLYASLRLRSRFVLYDDDTFALQFSDGAGFFEYPGTFQRAGSEILFLFRAQSIAGSWEATGTLQGTSQLSVRFNWIMVGSDFNHGVYDLVPESP